MTKINPYNFIPLEGSEPKRTKWDEVKKHHRLPEDCYSGHLVLSYRTITPVFIPSTRMEDVLVEQYPNKKGVLQDKLTYKIFHNNGESPTIPGTSIKGMVRSVFEALTNSCMPLFSETYGTNTYDGGSHKHSCCNKSNGLCPACAVFGTIQGEELHLQGKVRFSDAKGKKEDLEPKPEEKDGHVGWTLKELSSPKPERHVPFYAKDGKNPSSGPRGRKFYYHHDPDEVLQGNCLVQAIHKRNPKIKERLRAGARLEGKVDFQSLTEEELAALLFSIELGCVVESDGTKLKIQPRKIAHKIGMGKPLGLGSMGITVVGGNIEKGSEHYTKIVPVGNGDYNELRKIIDCLCDKVTSTKEILEVMGLSKYIDVDITYPSNEWFIEDKERPEPLGPKGEYKEKTHSER